MVKTWWNDRDVEIIEIGGEEYGLNGWNGEIYGDCFKVINKIIASKERYEIKPIYKQIDEDDFEIIDYQLL